MKNIYFFHEYVYAKLQENSLALLMNRKCPHPNWQMQYVEYLKKIFVHIKGCDFIIATHSHLYYLI